MIQSIEVERAPASRVSGVAPTAVLFQRRISRVNGVLSICVDRKVASPLRSVASAYGPVPQGPKSMLRSLLQKSRRAAAALKFERMQRQLADRAGREVLRRFGVRSDWSCGVASGGVELRGGELRGGELASVDVASMSSGSVASVEFVASHSSMVEIASSSASGVPSRVRSSRSSSVQVEGVMSKVASVASRQSIASQSVASIPVASVSREVGEWRQVGDALSAVLSRVSVLAEASARLSSVDSNDGSRMH